MYVCVFLSSVGEVDYNLWIPGEPSNDYSEGNATTLRNNPVHKWGLNDVPMQHTTGYICEKEGKF